MSPYFGTKVDIGERTIGSKLDVVVYKGPEGGDKLIQMIIKLGVPGDGA